MLVCLGSVEIAEIPDSVNRCKDCKVLTAIAKIVGRICKLAVWAKCAYSRWTTLVHSCLVYRNTFSDTWGGEFMADASFHSPRLK